MRRTSTVAITPKDFRMRRCSAMHGRSQMLGEEYTLEYLPLFDEELAAAVRYIAVVLENPAAAAKLVDDVERAITDRLFAPESFEPIHSENDREHPYYRIAVGNYLVLYCVIGKVMEVRRFVYAPSNWRVTMP